MSYDVIFTGSLSHHGIKGQRWGIRRFRNRDGTLKEAGKRRYNSDKKKSTHRLNLEQKYINSGLSKDDAEREADKKIKIEKGLAITIGATAITAASVIAYKKIGQKYADKVIKQGQTIHTLSDEANRVINPDNKYNEHFYATINNKDRHRYKGLFGYTQKDGKNIGKFDIGSKAKENLKVASPNNAKKVFIEQFKKDPEYAKYLQSHASPFADRNQARAYRLLMRKRFGQELSDKDIGKLYNAYNQFLVFDDDAGKSVHKKFGEALKKKGYVGTIDVNDMWFDPMKSKSPTIIFDKSKFNIENASDVKRLSMKEVSKAQVTELGKDALKPLLGIPIVGGGALSLNLVKKYDDDVIEKYKNKKGGNK